MNRQDLREYFSRLTKGQQDEFVGENSSTQKRSLHEGAVKRIYSECQNVLYEMAQNNGYVCHLCVSQSAKLCGMDQIEEINMDLCCKILEDCITDGFLQPGPCPSHPKVTVYFPVLEDDDDSISRMGFSDYQDLADKADFSDEYKSMIDSGEFYDK